MVKKNKFSAFDREQRIKRLSRTQYDLLVIGGGATGAGIALDAASRGVKVALVEKGDFASGTSSKSTKLIHGGLRYLKQLDIGLVHESGTERSVVNKIAPHLCIPEKMLLPLVENGTYGQISTSVGLWVYDVLAKVNKEDKRIMLSKKEALTKEPLLNELILKGAGYYTEFRTDDARLTLELIKKAAEYGAESINYAKVVGFKHEEKRVCGVVCTNELNGNIFEVLAKRIVSAGGPWVDDLRNMGSGRQSKKLHLTKGVHIVIPSYRLPINQSVYFDVPDGRMIFTIPRGLVTYIGTTDTNFTGHLDRVVATEADRDYLLKAVNHMFPDVNITKYDVVSSWAGLRPLIQEEGKSPSELSRKDETFEGEDGLISIAGGKLTGYRKMAEKIVDNVVQSLASETDHRFKKSNTKLIQLTPQPFQNDKEVTAYVIKMEKRCKQLGLEKYYGWYLTTTYGMQSEAILKDVKKEKGESPEVSLALAELRFSVNNEMVHRAEDFFIRRTGRLYFDIHSIQRVLEPVLQHMAALLNWSSVRIEIERAKLQSLIRDATHFYEDEKVEPMYYNETASV